MADSLQSSRIVSLDQFRGYTVAGMFLVNFVGSFDAASVLLTHQNNFCSYADTIMPQFFFAVGFAFRLTFGRRARVHGAAQAYGRAVRRILALALIAIVIYGAPQAATKWEELVALGPLGALQMAMRNWFQTLMHIAATSLWILPVIRAGVAARVAFAIASAALHVAVSQWFYFDWVQTGGIDGGVLGFLAWTLPTIAGTLACDVVVGGEPQRVLTRLFSWGVLLMLGGWLLSCGTRLYDIPAGRVDPLPEQPWAVDAVIPDKPRLQSHAWGCAEPPFVPPPAPEVREENYWMMSQRAATLSYHLFAAGLSLVVFGLFYLACDVWTLQLGLFRTLGVNALVGYILHGFVGAALTAFMPSDSPGWYVTAGFLLYFAIVYVFLRALEREKIYIKI
jgi:predicted acyltransferase